MSVEMNFGDYLEQCFANNSTSPAVDQFEVDKENFAEDKVVQYKMAAELFDTGYACSRKEVIDFVKSLGVKISVENSENSKDSE